MSEKGIVPLRVFFSEEEGENIVVGPNIDGQP